MITKHLFRKRSSVSLRKLLFCFPGDSDSKESACNAGDPGLIPGLGRSPGGGNGNPLQYSCQENSMVRGVYGVTESDTTEWLSFIHSWSFFTSADSTPVLETLRIWLPTRVTSPRHCCSVLGWVNQRSVSQENVSQQLWLRATKVYSCNQEGDPMTKKIRAETRWAVLRPKMAGRLSWRLSNLKKPEANFKVMSNPQIQDQAKGAQLQSGYNEWGERNTREMRILEQLPRICTGYKERFCFSFFFFTCWFFRNMLIQCKKLRSTEQMRTYFDTPHR